MHPGLRHKHSHRNSRWSRWVRRCICNQRWRLSPVRKAALLLLATLELCSPAKAAGWLPLAKAPPVCAQATAFIARTSGLSTTENNAYTAMICGMVTDGTWSLLGVLYIFATNTTTTAAINLVSSSFNGTVSGTLLFSADHGWTSNGSNGYLNTTFTPSTAGGNCQTNSCSMGSYDLTSNTGAQKCQLGAGTGGLESYICLPGSAATIFEVNGSGGTTGTISNAQGMLSLSRTGSSSFTVYENSAVSSTPSSTSDGLVSNPIAIFAFNSGAGRSNFTTDQLSAAFIGGGMTDTQAENVQTRINN